MRNTIVLATAALFVCFSIQLPAQETVEEEAAKSDRGALPDFDSPGKTESDVDRTDPFDSSRPELPFDRVDAKPEKHDYVDSASNNLRLRVSGLEAEVRLLRQQVDELNRIVRTTSPRISAKSPASSSATNVKTSYRGRLPDNPDACGESSQANQGRILFRNPSATRQTVYVNGSRWNVIPGNSFVWGNVGTVALRSSPTGGVVHRDNWKFNNSSGFWELTVSLRARSSSPN